MLKEFKEFIARGNVMDLAVGIIIGGAFQKIVSSLVNDIIMPLVTFALGASSLAELSIPLKWEYVIDATGERVVDAATGEFVKNVTLSWQYGNFLQTILDFLIIAFFVFLVLRIIMNAQNALEGIIKEAKHELSAKERRALRKQGLTRKQIAEKEQEIRDERIVKETADKLAKEQAEKNKPTTESLLTDIKNLLAEQTKKEEK